MNPLHRLSPRRNFFTRPKQIKYIETNDQHRVAESQYQQIDPLLCSYSDYEDSVYGLAWSSRDPWIFASLSYDGRVCLVDLRRAAWFSAVPWGGWHSLDTWVVCDQRGTSVTLTRKIMQNLTVDKHQVIERSIQRAYIQAIRSAQHYIYIENQYFLGSPYAWSSYKDAGADKLIPMELALNIASKIKAKERFAIYIVIPMWP